MRRYSNRILSLLVIGDLLAVLVSLWLADRLRFALPLGAPLGPELSTFIHPYLYLAFPAVWLLLASRWNIYQLRRRRWYQEMGELLSYSAVFNFALAGALYLTFREVSRLLFTYFVILQVGLTCLVRTLLHAWLRLPQVAGLSRWKTLLIGSDQQALNVYEAFQARGRDFGELVGYLNVPGCSGDLLPPDLCRGSLEELDRVIAAHDVDEVIVALPAPLLAETVVELHQRHLPVEVRAVPDFLGIVASSTSFEVLEGVPLLGIYEPAIRGVNWVLKRGFDVIVASVMLLVLSPLMLLLSLLIRWESPGPAVFRQKRVGENGRLFWMYKFRTMAEGAEEQLSSILSRSPEGKVLFKMPNDPRVTRVGSLLRRFSLDELPQLWNVLLGNMSLVGPRPEQPFIVNEYEPWQYKRLTVPPGMTGWWQVTGRDIPMHLSTEHDLFYIINYSFLLDLKILFLTFWAVFRGRGAY